MEATKDRLGERLLEDLLGLGVAAEFASETDGASYKGRLSGGTKRAARGDMYFGRIRVNVPQTEGSLPPREGRRYFCVIRLKDLSIDSIHIYSHYHAADPQSYQVAYNISAEEPGDLRQNIRRIKKLGRHLKAAWRSSSWRGSGWKGGQLADRLERDLEICRMSDDLLRNVEIKPGRVVT